MGNKENKSETDKKFERNFMNQAQSEESSSLDDYPPFCNCDINPSLDLSEISFDTQAIRDLIGQSKEEEKSKKIFNVTYPEKSPLFTYIENDSTDTSFGSELSTLKRKRFNERRRRRDNSDNIRKKIKGGFLNGTLIKKINNIIKENGSIFYFVKFPQKFISIISKKSNKKLLNMTLLEIFITKEIYPSDGLNNYFHNLQVIEKKEIAENLELKGIFNKKYCELFEEYINSKEFIVDEINRLKKKFDESYIENYIYLSKHLIEFFEN
jgi:hypothetical protein